MRALTFWKMITMDGADFLERVIALLTEAGITFCVVGGQAVNAYVEPVVSLDLDLVVAVDQIAAVEALCASEFIVRRFPHSLNISTSGSDLRVQIQTDPRYGDFVERATFRDILGLHLPVARVEDVLRGKVWAAQDPTRRPSKRQKDLSDIARLLEAYPVLQSQVPQELLDRLI
jgi:hypothetical protein